MLETKMVQFFDSQCSSANGISDCISTPACNDRSQSLSPGTQYAVIYWAHIRSALVVHCSLFSAYLISNTNTSVYVSVLNYQSRLNYTACQQGWRKYVVTTTTVAENRLDGPSTRPVNSASGNSRPSTRPVLTGNGNRSPINLGR